MEVYDSPGSGIGCWRSCGLQEWELISHEVILQLLFSTAHSLNPSNTTFSWLFAYAYCIYIVVVVRNWPPYVRNFPKVGDGASARCLSVCAILMCCSYMFLKMRNHDTHGRWDYFHEITWTKWGNLGRRLRGSERIFCGVVPTQEMMDYQQR